MTTKSCANGRGCAAVAVLGEPANLSRYNQEGVCEECLLRARRGGAEEEDMSKALRAARKKKPSAKDKAAREAPEADHERGRDAKLGQAPNAERGRGLGEKKSRKGKLEDTKKPAKDRQWLKVAEIAERLAISTSQVYAWIEQGELEATRFGPQTIRVRVSELERFEQEGIEG